MVCLVPETVSLFPSKSCSLQTLFYTIIKQCKPCPAILKTNVDFPLQNNRGRVLVTKQKNKTKVIRPNLLFWPILTHLNPFKPIRANLDSLCSIWTNFDPFGPIWTYFDLSGFISSYLELFSLILIYLDLIQAIWRYLKPFRAIWSNLERFGAFLKKPFGAI